MEEKEMPKLEEIQEEQVEVKPNIEEGLKAILESNDINELGFLWEPKKLVKNKTAQDGNPKSS